MASRSLCRSLLQASRAVPAKRKCYTQFAQQSRRSLSTTPRIRASNAKPVPPPSEPIYFKDIEEELQSAGIDSFNDELVSIEDREAMRPLYDPTPEEYLTPTVPLTEADLMSEERADYAALPSSQRADYIARLNHYKALAESMQEDEIDPSVVDKLESQVNRQFPIDLAVRPPKDIDRQFWAEDEDDDMGRVPDGDDEWDESHITTMAENELQLHREIRQYTRIAAWEMPLLTSMCSNVLGEIAN
jgi:hypothetical protein